MAVVEEAVMRYKSYGISADCLYRLVVLEEVPQLGEPIHPMGQRVSLQA